MKQTRRHAPNTTEVPQTRYSDQKRMQDGCSQSTFDVFPNSALLEITPADDDGDEMVIPKLSSTENGNGLSDKIQESQSTSIANGMQSLSQETSIPQSVMKVIPNESSPMSMAVKELTFDNSGSEEFERQMISCVDSSSTCTLGFKFSPNNNDEQKISFPSSSEANPEDVNDLL